MVKRALLTGVGQKYSQCISKIVTSGISQDFTALNLDQDLAKLSQRLSLDGDWNSIDHIDDDSNSPLPTKSNIISSINQILNQQEKTDLFLFYFSGHGICADVSD